MGVGPKIHTDNLLFGFDTGKTTVNDNTFNYSKYLGEPTVNYSTDSPSQGGWTGASTVLDSSSKKFRFNVSNFSANPGQGWRSFTWDLRAYTGQSVTISATVEVPDLSPGTFAWVMMGQVNTHTNTSGAGGYMGYSAASERYYKSTTTKEHIYWSGTIGNTGTANSPSGHIGFTIWYNNGVPGVNSFIDVSNVQIERNAHETPFVNGSRTNTNSLIDLKGNTGIDVSNLSFDSTGQPIFDGTDDYLQPFDLNLEAMEASTLEAIIYMDDLSGSHNSYSIFGGVATGNRHGYHEIRNSGSGWKMTYWTSANSWRYANTALSAGQYYHVVWVWKDKKCCWYVNGEDDGYYNFTTFSPYSLGVKTIGYFPNERYMDGHIPIARVYNKALTSAEINSNYKGYKNRFNLS